MFASRFFKVLAVAVATFLVASFPRPAAAAGMDSFGICDHPLKYDDIDAACDEIIASGVKWARVGVEWNSIEPNSGEIGNPPTDRLLKYDAVVDRLTDKGVNIVFVLGFTAPWASSAPNGPGDPSRYKPANWADWENYVHFVTNRYIGRIHYWEVWNEPDHIGFWKNSVQDYATLLQKAAGQIRATDPSNKILLGGLAMYNGTTDSYGLGSFFDTLLGLGAASNFDIINYHAYGDATRLLSLYNGMQAVISKYNLGSRKIWITEAGYSTDDVPAREVTKADYVDQTYLLHQGLPNIERIFWYVHRNPIVLNDAHESNFGLIANDRSPLKALYYYQAVAGAESDFKLQKEYPTQSPTRRTLFYTTGGDGSYVVDYAADGSSKRIPTTRYMYFRVNDNWLTNANGGLDSRVLVDVTYLNLGTNNWRFQYDATSGAYKGITVTKTNTGAWATATFTLDDAKFANSQNNVSDFRLEAGSADLIVSKVVVRKEMQKGRLVMGSPDLSRYLTRPDSATTTDESYNPLTTMGGKACRQILSNPKYIYVKVPEGLVRSGNNKVKIGIWFWDAGTDRLHLEYNATGAQKYKSVSFLKTNTLTWRYWELNITDADFLNTQNYKADFRIGNGYDGSVEYISQIDVEKVP